VQPTHFIAGFAHLLMATEGLWQRARRAAKRWKKFGPRYSCWAT
jgi:hypothetical protein